MKKGNKNELHIDDVDGVSARKDYMLTDNSTYRAWYSNLTWSYAYGGPHGYNFVSNLEAYGSAVGNTIEYPSGTSATAGTYAEYTTTFTPGVTGTYLITVSVFNSRNGSAAGFWFAQLYDGTTLLTEADLGSTSNNVQLKATRSFTANTTYTIKCRVYLKADITNYAIKALFVPVAITYYA